MYKGEEKLCLKWNDFQENINSAFKTLREDMEFADVTLACEDGHQVDVHKVILALSSPYFMNLLKRNKHPHPLIYMRGLKSEELVAIVDFLYHGEANIYQENLDSFLAVAEELQLKGLMGSGDEKEAEESNNKPTVKKIFPKAEQQTKYTKQKSTTSDEFISVKKIEKLPQIDGTLAVTDYTVAADLQDLDDKIKSMMGENKNVIIDNRKARTCKVCGKEGLRHHIKDHIEANHITGVSHTCYICGKISRSRNGLRQHIKITHHTISN